MPDFDPKKIWLKAKELSDHPRVREVARFCNRGLEVAAHLGQANLKGPLAAAGAVMGVANLVIGTEDRDTYEAVRDATRSQGLTYCSTFVNGLFTALWDAGFFADSGSMHVANKHYLRTKRVEGVTLGVVVDAIGLAKNYNGYFSGTLDNAQKILLRELFKTLDSDVVSLRTKVDLHGGNELRLFALNGFDGLVHAGGINPGQFAGEVKKAQAAGLSQAFFMTGPPGAGKTSLAILTARALDGRTLVIDQSIFTSESGELVSSILNAVKLFAPAVVLFDDIDGIGSGNKLLTLVDALRRENPKVLVLSATNYPEAILPSLRRPGRLGRRLNFGSPGVEGRKEIIEAYAAKLGLRWDSKYIETLADRMEHPLFTPDYIRDVCERGKTCSPEELSEYIDETLDYLKSLRE